MLNMLFVDPSAITVGVSVLNRVVCTYSSFEQLVVFVCFNIRELLACVTFSVRIQFVGRTTQEGFHLLVFINGQRCALSSVACPELSPS